MSERTILPPLDSAEQARILRDFNATAASFPSELCLHQLFEQQVARTPTAVAAVCGLDALTFGELSAQADRLAAQLRTLGLGPASLANWQEGVGLVALLCERSLDLIVGLLAVLKAGGAYVPIEPGYPRERVAFILKDTRARILITQKRLLGSLPAYEGRVVCIDAPETWADTSEDPAANEQAATRPIVQPEDLAYVMYTSGTTGNPKGVCVPHRGLVNLLHWTWNAHFKAGYLKRTLFSTSIGFDASVPWLFLPLAYGGTVVVVQSILALATPPEPGTQPGFEVTFINCTPSAVRSLLDAGCIPKTTRAVELGGEYVSPALVSELFRLPHIELVLNTYGPTEASVFCTAVAYNRQEPIPNTIGRPIANTQIYVLDEKLLPLPIGTAGELCVGGVGVAAGYLNRPELTAQKFVKDPFTADGGGWLYRTGDLARWQEGGTLEFLGRKDLQVKLRGYRIELAEIETVLSQHPAVQQNVVAVAGDQLVAYVTPAAVAVDELLAFLGARLPDYMVPARIVSLSSFPLNTQGKVDRQALLLPGVPAVPEALFTDPDERAIADLFAEVLGVRARPQDDFVALGGTSLTAVRLQARVRKRFDKETPLALYFQRLTVPKLASFLRRRGSHFDLWIPFNEGDAAQVPPLIYPHSAGGLAQSARWLAPYLGRRIPLYTFNHPHDRAMSAWPDLEAMAGFYVQALYEKFPQGPYMFVGHSFGVLLAYEMARQIRRDGRAVLFLGMVDQTAEPLPRIPEALLYYVAEEHLLYYDAVTQGCLGVQQRYHREMARQGDPKGWKLGGIFLRDIVMMLEQVLRCQILGKKRFLAELSAHYVRTMRANGGDAQLGEPDFLIPLLHDLLTTIGLGERYLRTLGSGSYGRLDVPAWLFRAKNLPPRTGTPRDKLFYGPADGGWNRFLCNPIKLVDCEGDHITMQTEPQVADLGQRMNQAIAAALTHANHPAAAALG